MAWDNDLGEWAAGIVYRLGGGRQFTGLGNADDQTGRALFFRITALDAEFHILL